MPSNLEWEREPPLLPRAGTRPPPPPPYSAECILTLLCEQPAVRLGLRVLALMPEEGIPWHWVDELAVNCGARPEDGASDLRALLEPPGLAATRLALPVARLNPELAALLKGDPQDAEAQRIFAAGRRLAGRRLREILAERRRRFNLLKAEGRDPFQISASPAAITRAWMMYREHQSLYSFEPERSRPQPAGDATGLDAPLASSQWRPRSEAVPSDSASWPDYGLWEKPYIHTFMRDELGRGGAERVEWVLGLDGVPDLIFALTRAPIDRLIESRPNGWDELRLKCRFLFEEGRRRSAVNPNGSGGWRPLNEAVEMLEEARPHHPGSPELEALWTEACRLRYLYDW